MKGISLEVNLPQKLISSQTEPIYNYQNASYTKVVWFGSPVIGRPLEDYDMQSSSNNSSFYQKLNHFQSKSFSFESFSISSLVKGMSSELDDSQSFCY